MLEEQSREQAALKDCKTPEFERKLIRPQSGIGRLVVSLAGRDKGSVLLIIGVCDDGTVLLADGRRRKVERPKRKKLRHLRLLEWQVRTDAPFTNRLLWETVRKAALQ